MTKRDRRRRRPAREALSHSTLYELLNKAGRERFRSDDGDSWCWVRDYSVEDGWVVYDVERWVGDGWDVDSWKVGFEYSEVPVGVTLADGDPEKVAAVTEYKLAESVRVTSGRLLEALDDGDDGHRIYRVQIIEAGMSKNGRMYDAEVLEAAAPLYDGAKAYDHHRTAEELETSTIQGLIGHYRNAEWTGTAIEAELHMLPSATHAREAMDASIDAQAAGLDPIIGISHDVIADMAVVTVAGEAFEQARHITHVLSSDFVAEPSAGGRGQRIVAGGTPARSTNPIKESNMNLKELLAALREETDAAKRQELLAEHAQVLEDAGLTADDVLPEDPAPADPEATDTETETETVEEPVLVGAGATERYARDGVMGGLVIREAMRAAGLDDRFATRVTQSLPTQFTEADAKRQAENFQAIIAGLEKDEMAPTVPHAKVTKESFDKKVDRLDKTFAGESGGYSSIRQAWADLSGASHKDLLDGDVPSMIMRESFPRHLQLGLREAERDRLKESISTATWAQVFADALNKRMIAEYARPNLQTWRSVVSSIVPRNDFRSAHINRVGGYGTLPAVAEGGPYQPLTSPTDEEVTYTISKRGGTEDLTMEAIANDDLGAVRAIPRKLGLAAAQTLYRFVWDFLATNPTIYDSLSLFVGGHSNTDTSAGLSQAKLSAGRIKMRSQAAYGDSSDILGIVPKVLAVPNELEEIAFQLATSAVAIPSSGESSDIPNIHAGLEVIVVDYWTDANDWFLVADPSMCPTIEVGFYQGRQEPELFVQDDPTQGAVFSSDKVTWKIRHIYSGAVLEYRGLYRGQG